MRSESTSRRQAVLALVVLLALGAWLAPSAASAVGRVALVVGNGAYGEIGTLPNPGNDAADVAAALGRLGFEVTTVRDADRAGLTAALRVFARRSAGADVSLVFYAGHGLEVDGVNYLVPVDARLERDTDVRFETVALYDVLASTVGASLRVVILDACRNNPLSRSMQRTGAARSVSRGSFGELNEALLGDETLVAYVAAAGTTAADGTGRNSPYTSALLAYLERPLEIGILFREVRARVLESTGGEQRPHEYASLLGEHYLAGRATAPVAGANEALVERENVFWQSIADSEDPADFRAYLTRYPNGAFALLARNRVAALGAKSGDPPTVEQVRPSDPQTTQVTETAQATDADQGTDNTPVSDAPQVPGPDPATLEHALGLSVEQRRLIQLGLAVSGFDPGAPDGVFGAATRAAIREWQALAGVAVTGYLGARLARNLQMLGSALPEERQQRLDFALTEAAWAEVERRAQAEERMRMAQEARWEEEVRLREETERQRAQAGRGFILWTGSTVALALLYWVASRRSAPDARRLS